MPTQDDRSVKLVSPTNGEPPFYYWDRIKTRSWTHSPRVNGKLVLRSNSYGLRNQVWNTEEAGSYSTWSTCYVAGGSVRDRRSSDLDPVFASLYNSAYGRMRGKLYKGNASLGVTFASWKQSREMVVRRSQQLAWKAEEAFAELVREFQKGRRAAARAAANTHLEIAFGWVPLLADIHNSCMTVIQTADKNEFVNATSETKIAKSTSGGFPLVQRNLSGQCRVRLSTRVVIQNPNAWLLERAGLLNPAAVAWDLVPWSFLVNMVVNTGGLVNSITDFAGLSFPDATRTDTSDLVESSTCTNYVVSSKIITSEKWKSRTMTSFPPPSLEFKIPEANWQTAAIAASLFVQKFSKIVRLVDKLL